MEENLKNKKIVDEVIPWKGLIIFLFGLIGLSLIYTIIFTIFDAIFQFDPVGDPSFLNKMDGIMQFSAYALGTITLLIFIGKPTLKKLFRKFKDANVYSKGVVYGFILLFAQIVYSFISTILFGEIDSNANQEAIIAMTEQSPVILFLTTVILAPLFEELVYRYGLFANIHKKNRYLAYIATLLIFGFIHFDFTCFTSNNIELIKIELINLPAYLLSGGILCFAYENEESIISPMIAHLTNNLIAFLQIILLF